MTLSEQCLRPNDGEVAAKIMDGEAILINITTGTYHSMDAVGGYVWQLIEKGGRLDQMAEAVSARYDVAADRALRDIEALAETLIAEGLVVTTPEAGAGFDEPQTTGLAYEAPTLNSFRDMSELLALDPPMPGMQQITWEEAG